MPNPSDAVVWSPPAFVLLTVVEMTRWRLRPDGRAARHEARDAVTSLGSLLTDLPGEIPFLRDRLLGSFAPEQERSVVGLTENTTTHNPPRVATS
ncbi:hypothetical protein [Streptomyces sp. NPDC059076]|uniref:hypothetical protein n=1 Tax=unclassified Streptomyces TaxID=2593676 RepID=UPI0036AB7C09